VNEWPHLGHIVSADGNDNADIINRRNILCGQINNVLCYFGKCQSVIKQKLLFAYCYSLYGNVLWDLNNRHVESVCVTWRKGLRRAWSLPSDTHCALLPVLSNTLPVIDELAKRSVRFLQRCLSSDSYAVRFIANYGVYVGRMFSPIGRNALFCCSRYGFSTGDLFKVTPTVIHKHCRSLISCELRSVTLVLLEMISVRDGAFCLHQFDDDVVKSLIECICSH